MNLRNVLFSVSLYPLLLHDSSYAFITKPVLISSSRKSSIEIPFMGEKNIFFSTRRYQLLKKRKLKSSLHLSGDQLDEEACHQHASTLANETRNDFDILLKTKIGNNNENDLIYFDSAATSQKPKAVMDSLNNYYTKMNSNVHRGAHTLSRDATSAYENSRNLVQEFINAKSRNEIVFVSGATEAINLVASTYGKQSINAVDSNQIVITEMEHHSNIVPWQLLVEEKIRSHQQSSEQQQQTSSSSNNKIIQYVKFDKQTGGLDMDHFESLLTEKTKVVSFQHVSNVCACINDVNAISAMVRRKSPNAKILLDACQSVPHMKVDVQQLDIDFLAASGHKMCGPTGIGFLWGKEDILNSIPPFMGGGEMIDTVSITKSTYAKSPGRFEAGTPAIAQAIGLGAAVQYLQQVGIDRIESYEHELGRYLYTELSKVEGITILGPKLNADNNRAALCSFVCRNIHPSDLSSFLDMEGVAIRAGHHCCQPLHTAYGYSHSARASLYFYNTRE